MAMVKRHFSELVDWLHYPIAVLVDDLDRCKGPYVVELLEGIQTLFRDEPVAFVIAADRDWLSDSYATEYRDFVSAADEPGRPLGYLFLEKTFQMSVTLPAPTGEARDSFWDGLILSGALLEPSGDGQNDFRGRLVPSGGASRPCRD
jgi:KAP family P-loop domain